MSFYNLQKKPDSIVIEIKRKNKARRKFQRHPTDNNRQELTTLTQQIHRLLLKHENDLWEIRVQNQNERQENVWGEIRFRKNENTFRLPQLKAQGRIVTLAVGKANILAETFASIYGKTINYSNPRTERRVKQTFKELEDPNNQIQETWDNQITILGSVLLDEL